MVPHREARFQTLAEDPLEIIKHEHKKQLHDRILERCAQLSATLVGLRTDAYNAASKRARAIEEALAALKTHLSGGWDSVDERESAELTRWLDSSRFLFDDERAAATSVVEAEGVQS
jgi:uncharacterized membrane protein YccC